MTSSGRHPGPPVTLKRRREFLRLRGGQRWSTAAFVIETKPRRLEEDAGPDAASPRFGFTVTRQLGNAVVRNRIRRRLKEAVRLSAPGRARPHHDYVVVARLPALTLPFAELVDGVSEALVRVHHAKAKARADRPGRPPAAT